MVVMFDLTFGMLPNFELMIDIINSEHLYIIYNND